MNEEENVEEEDELKTRTSPEERSAANCWFDAAPAPSEEGAKRI